ncbi:MAG: hypothetical protein ACSLEW_14375 [Nocardioides sp.]
MSLPDIPSPFRPPTEPEQPWWWSFTGHGDTPVEVPAELEGHRFVSQSDAETWMGLAWQELDGAGVAAVTLHDLDRAVYGPMSLSPHD